MDFHEFEVSRQLRPFGVADAVRLEAQLHRRTALARALWGRTAEDLQRQLLAPHPEIPPGYALEDFRDLEQSARSTGALLSRLRHHRQPSWVIFATRQFTAWEARCEIARRAVEFLENR